MHSTLRKGANPKEVDNHYLLITHVKHCVYGSDTSHNFLTKLCQGYYSGQGFTKEVKGRGVRWHRKNNKPKSFGYLFQGERN